MAKYSDIKGFTVQTVSTDPVASGIAGATWSSIASLNTARESVSSGGTTTAGIVAGGYDGEGYPSGYTGLTETWNGSAWTETADMNSGRTTHGFGTSTALIAGAGNRGVSSPPSAPGYQNLVESWNGSAWTEVAEYNNNKSSRGTAGQSGTAGIVFGGITPAGGDGDYTESWNGSSWTELGDLNASRYNLATNAGTQTSALGVGGQFPSPPQDGTLVESWNGSSWTEIAELNTARNKMGGSGTGNTSLLVFGGNPGKKANTESWDGSSWTERNDLSTAREGNGGFGTSTTSAIYAGGQDATTYTAVSEEFSPAGATESLQVEGQLYFNSTTNTFKETVKSAPTGAWASGGAMNTGRQYGLMVSVSGGPSGQSDALAVSGEAAPGNVANVEFYNGSAWTETTDVNTARRLGGGCGGQPAAVVAGGYTTGDVASTEVWNGSSWTETGDLNSAKRQFAGSFGSPDSSSDLIVAGAFPLTANTEVWDGSSWTETGNLNQQRYNGAGFGVSSTAGLIAGGQSSPSPIPGQTAYAENWNGSSWTEVAEFNTNRFYLSAAGEQTDGLIFGGSLDPAASAATEIWNGSSWTELNDLSTAIISNSGGGSSVAAISFAGGTPTITTASEEWTAALTNKTITSS